VPTGNFWLGNEVIHRLTWDGHCQLWFDIQIASEWYWAKSTMFIVANEAGHYRVTVSGNFGELQTDHHAA